MKCPYPNCRKDYNDDNWPRAYNEFVDPSDFDGSWAERHSLNRVFLVSRHCRFCHQYFHEVYVGHEGTDEDGHSIDENDLTFVASYPASKTSFSSTKIPESAREYFHEAERCRSVGSITGAGACLRKAIYAVCDDLGSSGRDYREKITSLPVREEFKDLLIQVKWLGDNVTKPGVETYNMEMLDSALEILPVVLDELYAKDERLEKATKLMAKARSTQEK